jgi:hypothetical protein
MWQDQKQKDNTVMEKKVPSSVPGFWEGKDKK